MSTRYIFLGISIVAFSLIAYVLMYYFNGRVVEEKYDSGELKATYFYRKGKIEGSYKEFYPNGQIKVKARFLDDLMVDTLLYYYPNGNLKERCQMVNNKKSGLYEEFYSDGNVKSIGYAKNGYKDSLFFYYSKDKSIDSLVKYKNGGIVIRAIFDSDKVVYEDYKNNFSISFPPHWELDLSSKVHFNVFRLSETEVVGDFTESINIIVEGHEVNLNFESFVWAYLSAIRKNIPSVILASPSYSGNKYEIKYELERSNMKFKGYITIFYSNDKAFIITSTEKGDGIQKIENEIRVIVDSFIIFNRAIRPKLFTV